MALLIKGRHSGYRNDTFLVNIANVSTISENSKVGCIGYDLNFPVQQGGYARRLVSSTPAIISVVYNELAEWLATHTDGLYDLSKRVSELEAEDFAKLQEKQNV